MARSSFWIVDVAKSRAVSTKLTTEVMCGMGRCASLYEWEQEGVVTDIQNVAKGLAGGFAPMAAIFISHRVSDALMNGSGVFSHGHTYQ